MKEKFVMRLMLMVMLAGTTGILHVLGAPSQQNTSNTAVLPNFSGTWDVEWRKSDGQRGDGGIIVVVHNGNAFATAQRRTHWGDYRFGKGFDDPNHWVVDGQELLITKAGAGDGSFNSYVHRAMWDGRALVTTRRQWPLDEFCVERRWMLSATADEVIIEERAINLSNAHTFFTTYLARRSKDDLEAYIHGLSTPPVPARTILVYAEEYYQEPHAKRRWPREGGPKSLGIMEQQRLANGLSGKRLASVVSSFPNVCEQENKTQPDAKKFTDCELASFARIVASDNTDRGFQFVLFFRTGDMSTFKHRAEQRYATACLYDHATAERLMCASESSKEKVSALYRPISGVTALSTETRIEYSGPARRDVSRECAIEKTLDRLFPDTTRRK